MALRRSFFEIGGSIVNTYTEQKKLCPTEPILYQKKGVDDVGDLEASSQSINRRNRSVEDRC